MTNSVSQKSRNHALAHLLSGVRWWRVLPASLSSGLIRSVLELVLVLILAFFLARLVSASGSEDIGHVQGFSVPVIKDSQASYALLKQVNPFSSVGSANKLSQRVDNVPETLLDMKLFGVRAGANPSDGSAIIKKPDGQQVVVRTGEKILQDVSLYQVWADRVVISRNGVLESLFLRPQGQRNEAGVANANEDINGAGQPVDFETLFNSVQLRPRDEGGRTYSGYMISAVENEELLSRIGLRQGDVILAVNDIRLINAEKAAEFIDEIKGLSRINILIEREGEQITLTLG